MTGTDKTDLPSTGRQPADLADRFAKMLGGDAHMLGGGDCTTVFYVKNTVVRISTRSTVDEQKRLLETAEALYKTVVAVMRPVALEPLVIDGIIGTLWEKTPDEGPLDWKSFGKTVKALHEAPAPASTGKTFDPVESIADLDKLVGRLDSSDIELVRWGLETAATVLEGTRKAVCHGDLWPKNVLSGGRETGHRPVLVDLDCLGVGYVWHDLALVAFSPYYELAGARGTHGPGDIGAFFDGYGEQPPQWRETLAIVNGHEASGVVALVEENIDPRARLLRLKNHRLALTGTV